MDLQKVIETDFIEKIKELITSKGISNNSKWLDYVVLNTAIKCGEKDIAKFLLNRKCRVNKTTVTAKSLNTPLHNAVELGDEELVQKLLDEKASIVAANTKNNSPLHLAFLLRQEKIVDIILFHIEQTSNYNNPKNSQGLTHLHIACTRNNGSIVSNYIKSGANVADSISAHSPLWSGYTALHFAVDFGSLEAIIVIKKANGYSYIGDSKGQLALKLAYEKLKEASTMMHILSTENIYFEGDNQTYLTYFHMACLRDDPEAVNMFIKNGAEVNSPISCDAVFCPLYTPLHFAVESNCQANVELLLRNGACAEFQDGHYMTPLHLALYNENHNNKSTIVDLLYDTIANKIADCTDLNGLSYFHVAITRNDVRSVRMFLDKGEDLNNEILYNLRNYSHYTPLHFAVRYGHLEMAEMLIAAGANVNNSDLSIKGTPLHFAIETGHTEIIELLLRNQARVNAIRPYDDKTMLHLLVQKCIDPECKDKELLTRYIERLVRLGCDVNAQDSDGNTALHLACSNLSQGSASVKFLLEFGADIDLMNNERQTPFDLSYYDDYKNNGEDFMILYEHVQKLKALGVKVSSTNQKCCEKLMKQNDEWNNERFKFESLARMQQERLDEIAKLKTVKLSKNISLFDFLTFDPKGTVKFAQNVYLVKIVQDKDFKKNYPSYAYLIKLQYQRGVDAIERGTKVYKKRPANGKVVTDPRLKRMRFGMRYRDFSN